MRLEKTVYPLEYCVYLAPNLSSLTFAGTVNVKCHTTSPRSEITLNCADLLLSTCSINGVPCEYTLEPDLERLVITAQKELTGNFLIEIAFTGIHNDRMHGFYASTYEYTTKDTRNVSTRVMVSTQCQATHCRRVFPCFDEPAFKAVFNVRVKTPNGYTALSNMHTTSEPNLNEDSNDSHLVEFAPTPLMSTYLFAVVVAELGYIEKQSASGTLCRVYTPPGLQDQGWFSMTVCIWALDFFSEHFGPFPLTKLDMVSIPDFTGYAMENWGLMLFKPLILLCDSSTSPTAKRELAGVVSHEVAHQWFGNLVTLEWWNATWLNEGFATYAGWLAVDVLFPSWDIWTFYIIDDLANALQLDALETSHAVDTKVANTSWQINAVFDAISYSKGAALIVMLSEHLGISTFMHGVRAYIQANQYANCTSHELFQCLARESGVDVVKMMDRWTTVKGFPLITVHDESYDSNTKEMHLIVSQEPFYAGGCRGDTDADQQPWAIPIQIGLGNGRRHACFFSTARSTLTFPLESCDAFYKLNDLKTGMYRTLDTRGHTRSLGECISKQNMPCADRIGVLSDVFALCKGGYLPTTDFLDLALCFSRETDHL